MKIAMKNVIPCVIGTCLVVCFLIVVLFGGFAVTSSEVKLLRSGFESEVGLGGSADAVSKFFSDRGLAPVYDRRWNVYQKTVERGGLFRRKIFIQIWMNGSGRVQRYIIEDTYVGWLG